MAESPEGKRQKLQGGGGTDDEHELAAGAGSSASTFVEDSQSRPSVDDECPMKLDGEDEESEVEDDDLPYLLGMIREEDKPIWAEYNRQVRESEARGLISIFCLPIPCLACIVLILDSRMFPVAMRNTRTWLSWP